VTSENGVLNAREESRRGDEALRAAEELLRLGLHNDAISRAYYAAYHWARAVLFTQSMESKTHRGTNQLLGLHFVRPGRLSQQSTTLLAQLEDRREASDYTAAIRFTRDDARESVEQARSFVALCRPLVP
jgi:uncharacterized protein (UPF0332 family)